MLIRNYGLLWERKYVFWGRGSNRGHLHGYRRPSDDGADFRDQIGIYVLYDKDLNAIYVGQAGSGETRLFHRLKQHTNDHLWNRWEYFSWFGFRRVNGSGALSEHDHPDKLFKSDGSILLNELEGVLLSILEPKLNKQGPRWKDVEEFYQWVDENLEERQVGEVLKRIDDLEKKIELLQHNI